ncbi:MAG: hypothetical protein AAF439_11450, partial [Pseudomonadota bacterium]
CDGVGDDHGRQRATGCGCGYGDLPLPRDLTSQLEKVQGGLTVGAHLPGSFMHIAVADLGEHLMSGLNAVAEKLPLVDVGPFYLNVTGLGTLGGQQPTEVYAEIDAARKLKELHKQVGRCVRLAGLELPHEKYTPRVTLAEIYELEQFDLKQIMGFLQRRSGFTAGPFPVTEMCLYVRREDDEGVSQEELVRLPLGG